MVKFLGVEQLNQVERLYSNIDDLSYITKESDNEYEYITISFDDANGLRIKRNLLNNTTSVIYLQNNIEYTMRPELEFDTMQQAQQATIPSNARVYIKVGE